MIPFLPLNRINESFEPELSAVISRVVKSGWYLRAGETEIFEKEFAEFCGMKNCIGVASGLDALTLIFAAYKIMGKLQDGDRVIVPANTFIASIMAISKNNLVPILLEPNEETFNINTNFEIRNAKAMLSVNLYGRLADLPENDLLLIEDCAQSVGIKPRGDAAAFSFYPGKNLGALGDGGAVVSNNDELCEIVRMLGNYGSQKKYVNDYLGFNSRLDEIQAAVLSVKLKRLEEDNKKRTKIAMRYIAEIKNPDIILPKNCAEHVWHLFVIRSKQRDALQKHLFEKGIETLVHYPIPPHLQKAYIGYNRDMLLHHGKLPITEMLAKEVLSLPLHQVITDEEVQSVIEAVN